MITQAEYKRGSEVYWIGQKVRTRHQIQNSWFTVPAGTEMVIVRKRGGFELKLAEPCTCCGLRGHIGNVRPELLERVAQ